MTGSRFTSSAQLTRATRSAPAAHKNSPGVTAANRTPATMAPSSTTRDDREPAAARGRVGVRAAIVGNVEHVPPQRPSAGPPRRARTTRPPPAGRRRPDPPRPALAVHEGCPRLRSRARHSTGLPELGVHVEPVPEPLQDVVDQPLPAVEESEPQEVPVDEVEEGPQEQRQPRVHVALEPALPPALPAGETASAGVRGRHRGQLPHRGRLAARVVLVFRRPRGEVLAIVVDEVVPQPQRPPFEHRQVLVHLDLLAASLAPAHEAQHPDRVHPAVAEPATHEVDSPSREQARHAGRQRW